MTPKRLKFSGLYSYREEQDIDFTQLTRSGLFGIFGNVGSGKSSILEAITYALYGQIERLGLRNDDRSYNMMNLQSNELNIHFEFEHLSKEYLFTAYSRRNRNNFNDISKNERKAYEKINGEWKPISADSASEILGLSYNDFKRIIIIPQGQFSDFISLSPADRTSMLKQLFNLDRYDLGNPTSAILKKTIEQIQNLEGQISALGSVSQQEITELEEDLKSFEKEFESLETEVKQLQQETQKMSILQENTIQLSNLRITENELKMKRAVMQKLETDLSNHQKFKQNILPQYEKWKDAKEVLEKTKQELDNTNNAIEKNNLDQQTLREQIDQITSTASKESLSRQLSLIDGALQYKKFEAEHNINVDKANALQIKKDTLQEEISKNQKELIQLQDEKKELAKILDEKNLWDPFKIWLQSYKKAQTEITNVQSAIQTKISETDQLKDDKEKVVQDSLVKWLEEFGELSLKEILNQIPEKHLQLKTHWQSLEKERIKLEHLSGLKSFAEKLNSDEPCPLCGSLSHPAPFQESGQERELELKNAEIKEVQTSMENLNRAESELNAIRRDYARLKNEKTSLETQLANREEDLTKLRAEYEELPFPLDSDLQTNDEKYNTAKRISDNLDKKITAIAELIDKGTDTELEEEFASIKSEVDQGKGKLGVLEENTSMDLLQLKKENLEEQETKTKKLISDLEALEQKIQQLETEKIILEADFASRGKEFSKQTTTEAQTLISHLQNLEENKFTTEEFEKNLDLELDIEATKNEIDLYKQKVTLNNSKIEEIEKLIGDSLYDEELHKSKKSSYDEKSLSLTNKIEEKGKKKQHLAQLKENFSKKTNLLKELNQLSDRKENLMTLSSLFRGNAFLQFASNHYLETLFAHANRRFEALTNHKLSMEIDEKNNFMVRDFLNGGQRRLLKTLSGGQTFQAALSLALALSEQIQYFNKSKQSFFFLDEGFGSLDPDSLAIVMETLRSLQHEDRVVGVISHVNSMQHDIELNLQITLDAERGSMIEKNY
ncbi:MAG: SMC family ATPase [Weeksellaceae bacterium]|nr:SMC family ATPase [Weeksellaceae bacterium]